MHAKDFINEHVDYEIALAEAEINRLKALDITLAQEINDLQLQNDAHQSLISKLEEILTRLGDILTEEFKAKLQSQIDTSKAVVAANDEKIAADKKQLEENLTDIPILEEYVVGLNKLKKKDENRAVGFVFLEIINGEEREMNMDFQIDKQKNFKIVPVDSKGNEAVVDGALENSIDAEYCTIEGPSEDGKSGKLVPTGKLGVAEFKSIGDALVGEGREEISGSVMLAFLPGKAIALVQMLTDAEPEAPSEG